MDARNPLLFRCKDLEAYTKEVSSHKDNLILINKADFLTEKQRQTWADYFTSLSVRVAFFSATLAAEEDNVVVSSESSNDSGSETESEEEGTSTRRTDGKSNSADIPVTSENQLQSNELPKVDNIPPQDSGDSNLAEQEESNGSLNSAQLMSRKDLISFLKTIHKGKRVTDNVVTIGLVGYPNVGKSSTINSLMAEKKVSVSATPGKTKHFQVSKS